jgi:hypothetical protein
MPEVRAEGNQVRHIFHDEGAWAYLENRSNELRQEIPNILSPSPKTANRERLTRRSSGNDVDAGPPLKINLTDVAAMHDSIWECGPVGGYSVRHDLDGEDATEPCGL